VVSPPHQPEVERLKLKVPSISWFLRHGVMPRTTKELQEYYGESELEKQEYIKQARKHKSKKKELSMGWTGLHSFEF